MWFPLFLITISSVFQLASALQYGEISPETSLLNSRLRARQQLQQNTSVPNSYGISPVALSDDGQTYYVVLQAGDISFRVGLDTGSSDLWLMSTDCSTQTCTSVPRYPLNYNSPTFASVNNNATLFNLSYSDTTAASGFVARESVYFANVTAHDQAFGVVTNSNVTMDDQISGVLGLGFPRLSEIYFSTSNATPFLSTLAEHGILDYPVFGLSLTRNSSGTLAVGAIDASIVQNVSNIFWSEVVPFGPLGNETTSGYFYWAIQLKNFAVNGSTFTPIPTYPGPTDNSSIALIDVGTSGIYGPYQDVTRLFSSFPGSRLVDESGQWVVPCDSSATMSFSFSSDQIFVLQPSDYLIGPAEGDPELCLAWPKASPPSSDGVDWQLGTPFLRTVYSIFSYGIDSKEPPMIGLYPRNNASALVESVAALDSFFSSESATVATTLPNYLLSTPTYTTPPYTFATSVPAYLGEIVTAGLATSTYSEIIGTRLINATALPVVEDVVTFIVTNADGAVYTSTSHVSQPSVTLGLPPGWSSGESLRVSGLVLAFSCTFTTLFAIVGLNFFLI